MKKTKKDGFFLKTKDDISKNGKCKGFCWLQKGYLFSLLLKKKNLLFLFNGDHSQRCVHKGVIKGKMGYPKL